MNDSFITSTSEPFLEVSHSLNHTSIESYQRWTNLMPYFIYFGMLSITAILVNFFVLLLFFFERASIKTAHKYIISISINDLIKGICFAFITYVKTDFGLFNCPKHCVITSKMGIFMTFNTLSTILIATIDRYRCIAYPVHYKSCVKHYSTCEHF